MLSYALVTSSSVPLEHIIVQLHLISLYWYRQKCQGFNVVGNLEEIFPQESSRSYFYISSRKETRQISTHLQVQLNNRGNWQRSGLPNWNQLCIPFANYTIKERLSRVFHCTVFIFIQHFEWGIIWVQWPWNLRITQANVDTKPAIWYKCWTFHLNRIASWQESCPTDLGLLGVRINVGLFQSNAQQKCLILRSESIFSAETYGSNYTSITKNWYLKQRKTNSLGTPARLTDLCYIYGS